MTSCERWLGKTGSTHKHYPPVFYLIPVGETQEARPDKKPNEGDSSLIAQHTTTNWESKAVIGKVQSHPPPTGVIMTTATLSTSSGFGGSSEGFQKLDSRSSLPQHSQSTSALSSLSNSSQDVGLSSRVTTGMEESSHMPLPSAIASAPTFLPTASFPVAFHPSQSFAPPLIPSQLNRTASEPISFPNKQPSQQQRVDITARGMRTNADFHLQSSTDEDSSVGHHSPPSSKSDQVRSFQPPVSSQEPLEPPMVSVGASSQPGHSEIGKREHDQHLEGRPLERERRDYHQERVWDYDHPRDERLYDGYNRSHEYYDRTPHPYDNRRPYRPRSTLPHDSYDQYYNSGYQDQYDRRYWDDPNRYYYSREYYHNYNRRVPDREYYSSYERDLFYQQQGHYPPSQRESEHSHRDYQDPYYHDGYQYDHHPPHSYEPEHRSTSVQSDYRHHPQQEAEHHSSQFNKLETEGPDTSAIYGKPERLDLSSSYASPSISYPSHHPHYDQEPPRESTLIDWQGYQDSYGYPPQEYQEEGREYEHVDVGPRYPTVGGAGDEEQLQQPFIPIRGNQCDRINGVHILVACSVYEYGVCYIVSFLIPLVICTHVLLRPFIRRVMIMCFLYWFVISMFLFVS